MFTVGTRVISRWNGSIRRGVVVELYNGRPSAIQPGVDLMAIEWDDTHRIERGYLNRIGSIEEEPLSIA